MQKAKAAYKQGLDVALETGFAFHGPCLASAYALSVEDRKETTELMQMAGSAIAAGCVGHNQFWVYADGIDLAVQLKDQSMLRRYIELLEAFPQGETVDWSRFHALRGRALTGYLEAPQSAETWENIQKTMLFGKELGMHFWCNAKPFCDASNGQAAD